jgi:hypothetical protein
MHVRIFTYDEGKQLVADLPDWAEQVPAPGDYLFHPPLEGGPSSQVAGCVKTRTWHMYDRPANRRVGEGFRQAQEPYVELVI